MTFHPLARLFCLIILSLLYQPAVADSKVFSNQRMCDAKQRLCIRASLYFDDEKQQLLLQGRVLKAAGPGRLELKVVGMDRQGKRYQLKLKGALKGKYSELIKITSKKLAEKHRKTRWNYQPIRYR